MRIFITGATGLIGSAITERLIRSGHQVVAGVHRRGISKLPNGIETVEIDYQRDSDVCDWQPRLAGVDAVVNAVGILRERSGSGFEAIHSQAPQALFKACEKVGVRRVVQISALGTDRYSNSNYHRSKLEADNALRSSSLDWTIVQPSLVFGVGGASTRLFLALASLPLIPLVGRGEQRLQPIHIDDLACLIERLLVERVAIHTTVEAAGRDIVTLRELLLAYRHALGIGHVRTISVPMPLMRIGAWLGDAVGHGALSTETLDMLQRGNSTSTQTVTKILRRPPLSLSEFFPPDQVSTLRLAARWSWLRLFILASLAFTWIMGGLVSALFAREYGLDLLAKIGLSPSVASAAFIGACTLNLAIGAMTLARPGRLLWIAQLGVMVFYTATLSLVAPHLWTDPFGPLVKNIPLAVLVMTLMATEQEA